MSSLQTGWLRARKVGAWLWWGNGSFSPWWLIGGGGAVDTRHAPDPWEVATVNATRAEPLGGRLAVGGATDREHHRHSVVGIRWVAMAGRCGPRREALRIKCDCSSVVVGGQLPGYRICVARTRLHITRPAFLWILSDQLRM